MPNGDIDINGLVGIGSSIKRSVEPQVGRVNVVVRGDEDLISDATDAFSKVVDEATSLAEAASKRSTALSVRNTGLEYIGKEKREDIADLVDEAGDLAVVSKHLGNLRRDEIPDYESDITSLVSGAVGLLRRESISDLEEEACELESKAKDLIAKAKDEIKAAE
ncbi:hypothetical protein N7523_004299 [Penicillium sp. IBT 18751x]|nr:hypothetical protein N7523_004299 [Penicillium sp. IBT 18751x]